MQHSKRGNNAYVDLLGATVAVEHNPCHGPEVKRKDIAAFKQIRELLNSKEASIFLDHKNVSIVSVDDKHFVKLTFADSKGATFIQEYEMKNIRNMFAACKAISKSYLGYVTAELEEGDKNLFADERFRVIQQILEKTIVKSINRRLEEEGFTELNPSAFIKRIIVPHRRKKTKHGKRGLYRTRHGVK